MKKNIKKMLVILFTCVFSLQSISVYASDYTINGIHAFSVEQSGVDNSINWDIDNSGVLTITGSGDYNKDTGMGWLKYSDSITSAVVNITGITNTSGMFEGCSNLKTIIIDNLGTSLIDMSNMFSNCVSLESISATDLSTEKVTDMSFMFNNCSSLNSFPFLGFDTSSVETFNSMFSGCTNLASCYLGGIDVSSVEDVSFMFNSCSNLTSIDLSSWATTSLRSMQCMFRDCYKLLSINLDHWNTSNVTQIYQLFNGCKLLKSINLGSFDLKNIVNMEDIENAFARCTNLTTIYTPRNLAVSASLPHIFYDLQNNPFGELPINQSTSIELCSNNEDIAEDGYDGSLNWSLTDSGFLTITGNGNYTSASWLKYKSDIKTAVVLVSNITSTSGMFDGCSNMTSIDVSSLDFSKVENMCEMFKNCNKLSSLDLSKMDSSSADDMSDMFIGCSSLSTIKCPTNLTINANLPIIYYDKDNTSYTSLPMNNISSITIYNVKNNSGNNGGNNGGNDPINDPNNEGNSGGNNLDKPNSTIKLSSLNISGFSKNIAYGKKIKLSAVAKPSNATNKTVTWKSSNTKYATVSSTGLVSTKKSGKGKTVIIKAYAKDGSGKIASYKIKIMKGAVKKIVLKGKKTLKAGKSVNIKTKIKTSGKKAYTKLSWSVSNSKFATINSKGKLKSKKIGKGKSITVFVKSLDGTNKKAKLKIKLR